MRVLLSLAPNQEGGDSFGKNLLAESTLGVSHPLVVQSKQGGPGMKSFTTYHGAGILCYTQDNEGSLLVLLGKRSVTRGYGKWSIPGGGWETKDGFAGKQRNYERTARRETAEEMGIEVGSLYPLWKSRLPYFHYEVFASPMEDARAITNINEFSSAGWFPLEALPKPLVPLVRLQVRALARKAKTLLVKE